MFDVKMALSNSKTGSEGARGAQGDWFLHVLMYLSASWLFQPHRR